MLKEFDFHDLYLHVYMDNLRAKETLFCLCSHFQVF